MNTAQKQPDLQDLRVKWYLIHGRYPERIRQDGDGRSYVLTDKAWNQFFSAHREFIEPEMDKECFKSL